MAESVAKASKSKASNELPRERAVLRLHPDTKARAEYWALSRGFSSVNEYMATAVEEKIARENGDYDLPTLEIARLNQVVDEMKALSVNVANLERVTNNGLTSLLGMTRGDNYLMDREEEEL